MRAVLILPDVACIRCIPYLSSDHHQKWPRTHLPLKFTPMRVFCWTFPPLFTEYIDIFSRDLPPSARHPLPSPTGMQLYDSQGHRLYLTSSERAAFRSAAEAAPREVRTYCWTLLHTGCRPSEALALTADRVDVRAAVLTFESRKKRRLGVYRAVPVPATLLDALDLVHGLRDRAPAQGQESPSVVPGTHVRSGGAGKVGCVPPFTHSVAQPVEGPSL